MNKLKPLKTKAAFFINIYNKNMYIMIDKIKNFSISFFKYLFMDNPGLTMILAFAVSLISLFIWDNTDSELFLFLGYFFGAYTILLVIVYIIFGWIINPLRDKKNKKEFEENKEDSL